MKVKLLRLVVVKDNPGAQPGDVVDVPHGPAQELICAGCAEEWSGASEPAKIEVREPVVENRDPGFTTETAPKLKGKRR